jgi:hypothetical protein
MRHHRYLVVLSLPLLGCGGAPFETGGSPDDPTVSALTTVRDGGASSEAGEPAPGDEAFADPPPPAGDDAGQHAADAAEDVAPEAQEPHEAAPVVCDVNTCAGCCDANGACQAGTSLAACGTGAATCGTCTTSCSSGSCAPLPVCPLSCNDNADCDETPSCTPNPGAFYPYVCGCKLGVCVGTGGTCFEDAGPAAAPDGSTTMCIGAICVE